jgi:hypothetical protein
MRIFICHAHEQADLAATLATRLRVERHRPFLDTERLRPSRGFDQPIRDAIAACDLFLFLISPDSARPGYARSELKLAQDRWPDPSGRVLPVMVEATSLDLIPPYVRAINILKPEGDVVAEIVADVARRDRHRQRRFRALSTVGALVVLGAGIASVSLNACPAGDDRVPDAGSVDRPTDATQQAIDAFSRTRVCTPTIEDTGDKDVVFLVCRCPKQSSVPRPNTLRIRRKAWKEQGWSHVGARARDAWADLPCP